MSDVDFDQWLARQRKRVAVRLTRHEQAIREKIEGLTAELTHRGLDDCRKPGTEDDVILAVKR